MAPHMRPHTRLLLYQLLLTKVKFLCIITLFPSSYENTTDKNNNKTKWVLNSARIPIRESRWFSLENPIGLNSLLQEKWKLSMIDKTWYLVLNLLKILSLRYRLTIFRKSLLFTFHQIICPKILHDRFKLSAKSGKKGLSEND